MAAQHACPHCDRRQEIDADVPVENLTCRHCGKPLAETAITERPLPPRTRSAEEGDEWGEPELELKRASVPGSVIAAGIVWIIFGCLSIADAFIQMSVAGQNAKGEVKGKAFVNPQSWCCGIIIGAVFLHVGGQSVRGTAKDVLGNAIGSILFGVLYTGIGIALLFTSSAGLLLAYVFLFVLALPLYAAGALALVARSDYKAFRRATQGQRRQRRSAE
jgi:hypothetical protein